LKKRRAKTAFVKAEQNGVTRLAISRAKQKRGKVWSGFSNQ